MKVRDCSRGPDGAPDRSRKRGLRPKRLRRWLRFGWLFALVACLWGRPSSVVAQTAGETACDRVQKGRPKHLTIQLSGEPGQTPSHTCIVSRQLVTQAIPVADVLPPVQGPRRAVTIFSEAWNSAPQKSPQPFQNQEPDNWPTKQPGGTAAPSQVCSTSVIGEDCQPQFSLAIQGTTQPEGSTTAIGVQKRHYIQCVKNGKPYDTELRVAVLLVDAHTGKGTDGDDVTYQPLICAPRLDRSQVSLQLERVPGSAEQVVVSVIGGHYLESAARLVDENSRVDLPLVPRCEEHDIVLPATAMSQPDAKVRLTMGPQQKEPVTPGRGSSPSPEQGQPNDVLCTQNVSPNGHFNLLLPNGKPGVRKTVEVEIGRKGTYPYARYEASWYDASLAPSLALKHAAISFRWKRDCLYPLNVTQSNNKEIEELKCPTAFVQTAGIDDCKVEPEGLDECRYVCDARDAPSDKRNKAPEIPFDLPSDVRFRRSDADDAWTLRLLYGNQLLSGFVPPEDRHVDVDLSAWAAEKGGLDGVLSRRAARIDKIFLRGPNGDLHYLLPRQLLEKTERPQKWRISVDLPGARCNDAVTYRILGERPHKESTVKVDKGRLLVPVPPVTEDVWMVSFGTGASFIWPTVSDDWRRVPIEPAAALLGTLGYRFPGQPWVLEARYNFLIGSQTYFRVLGPTERSTEPSRVVYNRHLFEAAFWFMCHSKLRVGSSAGILVGTPFLSLDRNRVGDADIALTSQPIMVHFQPHDHWGAEVGLRLIFGEPVYSFQSDFFVGSPTWSKISEFRGGLDLRLRYSL